jgi:hypothetical protein
MRRELEMVEGSQALQKFEDTMRSLFAARKAAPAPATEQTKNQKPQRKKQKKGAA